MATTATIGASSRPGDFPPSTPWKRIDAVMVADGSTGALAGDIPASVFGLKFIETATPAVKNDDSLIVVVAPAHDGGSLLGKAAATAAAANIPAGTYYLQLVGY